MIKPEILKELPNVAQRHKVNKCCWKNGTDRFVQYSSATSLHFVKHTSSVKSGVLVLDPS